MEPTLKIEDLEVVFNSHEKRIKILRGVNLNIMKNESVALAGESGSGKTMTAMSVMKLLPKNLCAKGSIFLEGRNVLCLNNIQLRQLRGRSAGMIFQEPSSYLNPLFTVGSQIDEAIKENIRQKKERTMEMLAEVGLERSAYYQYPHQLSGGMQQRVMIAMALINSPALLIADEPTTALDVTTAYGIIELMKKLMGKYGLSVLFITHDISLAANFADKIGVMYAGRIVELAEAKSLFSKPLHPYTERLMECLPDRYSPRQKIKTIEGSVPDFSLLPRGCPFCPRCAYANEICGERDPDEITVNGTKVRCFKYGTHIQNCEP